MSEPNFTGVQFERVRRLTDLPVVRLKERLDRCYYGDRRLDKPELAGQFAPFSKHYWANGWQAGVSNPFVAKRNARRPLIIFDIRPANPLLTGKAVWNGTIYVTSPMPLSPIELHRRLSAYADDMLAVRWVNNNAELPQDQRHTDIDDDRDDAGALVSRKTRALARLAAYVAVGIEIDDAEAA